MTDTNQNILSLSIPTDILTGAGGGSGLSLNYNFGSNADTITKNAYSFLGSRLDAANAFEKGSINSTYGFLNGAVSPIISAVAGEADKYYSQILGGFNSTTAMQQQTANAAFGVQQEVADASLKVSKKASGGGSIFSSIFGGCFITTAVCKYSGEPDDCDTLQTMRSWRDGFMQGTQTRRDMVDSYYIVAPVYVAQISELPESEQRNIWTALHSIILDCVHAIKIGDDLLALSYYCAAVTFARVASKGIES